MVNKVRKAKALKKMTTMDFPRRKVTVVLNELLGLYDNKWKLIEENDYEVLVNAILAKDESDEEKEAAAGNSEVAETTRSQGDLTSQPSPEAKEERRPLAPHSSWLSEDTGHLPPKQSRTVLRAFTFSMDMGDASKQIIPYERRNKHKMNEEKNEHTMNEEKQITACLDDTSDDEISSGSWSDNENDSHSVKESKSPELCGNEHLNLDTPLAIMDPDSPPLREDPMEVQIKKSSPARKKGKISVENLIDAKLGLKETDCQTESCFGAKHIGYDENRGKETFEETPDICPTTQLLLTRCKLKSYHDHSDIAKGEERFRVPVAGYPNCTLPSFNYIRQNVIHGKAFLDFSVSVIRSDSCCPECSEDCLESPNNCACAKKFGGKFCYARDCQVEEDFLDACIALRQNQEKHQLFYCEDCPIMNSLNKVPSSLCKGHRQRKFIKECWINCGCKRYCQNRVVQNGISCNLEVFETKLKGWGLRTHDELPKGSFVCEYAGEIMTTSELHDRIHIENVETTHAIPLDADWGSRGCLKDREALFLDATNYANAAMFINHRCFDANLVEIPVEVETPDRRYYHLALFTTRDVQPFEELTWDYGIDFENPDHLIKTFQCYCGSKFCRDPKKASQEDK